jgi:hypothetical protein
MGNIEHRHFSRLVHGNEKPPAIFCDAHQLRPTAFRDSTEIVHRPCRALLRIDQAKLVGQHSCGVTAFLPISGNQFHVDCSTGIGNFDGPQHFPSRQIPHAHTAPQSQPSGNGVERRPCGLNPSIGGCSGYSLSRLSRPSNSATLPGWWPPAPPIMVTRNPPFGRAWKSSVMAESAGFAEDRN